MAGTESSIDSQHERMQQLRKQLMWYKSFFDNAADAMFIVQPDTWSVLDANEYAAVLTGMPRMELVGASLPQFRRIFKLLTKSSSPTVLSELTFETPQGNTLMVEISARFIEFDGQRLIQALARDVTEQRELTDKLVQADKMVLLGQLSAGVAHEIRNPLAAINLNLQILQRIIAQGTPEYNCLDTALQGVERIGRIVEATLNFSRPTIGNTKAEDINEIIRETLSMVAASFARKTITVHQDFSQGLPRIIVDAKQIQQVFINLLTNAADAIRAKGKIQIRTYLEKMTRRGEEQHIVTAITDDGIGISEEDLTKIFNPFFTRKADGTGLGLPITQRIVHQHNGSIEVESTVGTGTTFYVKLPIPHDV
jgi:PAS domain S-box-containing protein